MGRWPGEHVPQLKPTEIASVRTVPELAVLLRKLRRREARRRKGAELTYRHLAARAGWSHAVVAAYLTGQTLPPTDRFDALIQLLGATPAEQGALATARDQVAERRRPRPGPSHPGNRTPVPRQLPADLPRFTGRTTELARLDRMLDAVQRPAQQTSTVAIAAITGTAGVGKTALAVHWAHLVKPRFPHGQLYADLRGYGAEQPVAPERILDRYLAGLGVPPERAPRDLDAKAALYRSLLDGRRLLVLLDNAASPQQIRPLLPASRGCLVAVTSRNALTGLVARDRAQRIDLDVLPVADAVTLLAGFIGGSRVGAEPVAAAQLAQLCAGLPVALCAVGERAAARPHATLTGLGAELTGAEHRLELLDVGTDQLVEVRSLFSWSYRRLPPDAARLFRLLGRQPGRDVDRYAAAALAGTDPDHACRLIDALAAESLLQPEPPDRYRLHDLLRAYAAELSHSAPTAQPWDGEAAVTIDQHS